MDDHDIPINVIIIEDIDTKTDVIINDYISEILVRDIQTKAKLLEDTKKD